MTSPLLSLSESAEADVTIHLKYLSVFNIELKILNLVSGFLKRNPIFCELSYRFQVENFQKTGLDVLFYG